VATGLYHSPMGTKPKLTMVGELRFRTRVLEDRRPLTLNAPKLTKLSHMGSRGQSLETKTLQTEESILGGKIEGWGR